MREAMLALLRGYKLVLSPALQALGIRCRHEPSCSSYAIEAVRRHGAWYGGWMTLARLSRCHPVRRLGGSSGLDNVPESLKSPSAWTPWKVGVWRIKDSPDADTHIS